MQKKFRPVYDYLVITGPTASGKTTLAVELALITGGEIISADSRQVYRGMDLGTGKDYSDYSSAGRSVTYHLIDIVDPGYKYNVFEYQRDFKKVYTELSGRGVFPVVCGGSGMYIDSITKGYEMTEVPPDSGLRARLEKKTIAELTEILSTYRKPHNTTDLDSKKRVIRAIEIEHFNTIRARKKTHFPQLKAFIAGVMIDRETRRKRITERLHNRLKAGMVEEVRKLLDNGVKKEILLYYGLEYKYITLHLTGKLKYDKMVNDLEIAIHQYAKRQMTWFRGMERKGTTIHWIDGNMGMEQMVGEVMDMITKE